MLTETILLGNVAMRVGKNSNGTAEPERHQLPRSGAVHQTEYRKGWTL